MTDVFHPPVRHRAPAITAEMLPERFRYLFDNLEEEIKPILEADRVMTECRGKLDQYNQSIKECDDRETQYLVDREAAEAKLHATQLAVKEAEKDLRIAQGNISRERHNKGLVRRYIKTTEMRMMQREKNVMLYEARKRLNAIGRTIKRNSGARVYRGIGSGGGFDIVKIDAPK